MRLVTRGDMDGLTSSVILSANEEIDEIRLIHPQDITGGRVEITADDVLVNVPFHSAAGMWFDHHLHTATYSEPPRDFHGAFGQAPSAARLVYEYYGGEEAMPQYAALVAETDRMDSADLGREDILDPRGYILLGFTIDSRSGIGAFEDYFLSLQELLRAAFPVTEILEHPAVRRRVQMLAENDEAARDTLRRHSVVDGNVVITDLRDVDVLPIGNRFLIYALFPEANVSLRLHWGPGREFVVAAVGHSILNRSCATNVGLLAARLGGGGHHGAGSIPIPAERAGQVIGEIVDTLKRNG